MTASDRPRLGAAVAVAIGFIAVVLATAVGWNGGWLDAVVTPPAIVRAFLVGLSVAVGVMLLMRSVARMGDSGHALAGQADVPGLIRAVRLAFLAVAAFAAAAGWALGHPLPLIVAAVIAGIDVIETSFLLLVVGRGR
ncbi:MAG TPA: hypothetical protein VK867_01130 [Candidatus Limnocylindrales bacterium]|nr:hypothetical protein [Candidatus Limnocylindrales bacterium]